MRRYFGFALLGLAVVLAGAIAIRTKPVGPASVAEAPAADPVSLAANAALAKKPIVQAAPRTFAFNRKKLVIDDGGAAMQLPQGETARLTLDPDLQLATEALLRDHGLVEGAVVLLDSATGEVLVYASYDRKDPDKDHAAEAKAPAASVFKIATAAALVERAGLTANSTRCYAGGGEHRIDLRDLTANDKRDRTCVNLAGAMGRSTNTVFARFADEKLTPLDLETVAKRLGWASPLAFDVPIQASALKVPSERLEFARTAAGFWNSTLSPLHGAWLAALIARGGTEIVPHLRKAEAASAEGRTLLDRTVTDALTQMLEKTVTEGTARHAFAAASGEPYLKNVRVAGKTGTLASPDGSMQYTWFVGFLSKRPEGTRPLAIAALAVNGPKWTVKANVLAREVLELALGQSRLSQGTSSPRATGGARSRSPLVSGPKPETDGRTALRPLARRAEPARTHP